MKKKYLHEKMYTIILIGLVYSAQIFGEEGNWVTTDDDR